MASAKNEAIKKLGKEDDYINLKGFNTERTNAQNVYNTNYNALQNEYNRLIKQAEQNKLDARSDFDANRSVVNSNSYMNNRGITGAQLSNRSNSSGLDALGRLANTFRTNQANSDIANAYYNSMADIQRDIDVGTETHNYNVSSLKNNLAGVLADINAREADRRNAYKAAVANLAEQIENRWAIDAQTKAINKANSDAAKRNAEAELALRYANQLNGSNDINDVVKLAQTYAKERGGTVSDALKWLQEKGVFRMSDVVQNTKKTTSSTSKNKTLKSSTKSTSKTQSNLPLSMKIQKTMTPILSNVISNIRDWFK